MHVGTPAPARADQACEPLKYRQQALLAQRPNRPTILGHLLLEVQPDQQQAAGVQCCAYLFRALLGCFFCWWVG